MNAAQIKQAVKEAVAEALREQRGELRDVIEEVFEEVALVKAMREGDTSERVSREDVFAVLEGEGNAR